ncbi:SPFH domain-containing protein [Roseivirga pacifica]|uniref:SPFH domain, Band 7 family protein n=1 Tax=Roseivirga pacifica TaxID=1267423 RepID=A0A1I0PZ13_9BACT|nr:prohibitin family protein [Roseivirga pacifica]RKQ43403.1 SPFH domain-containing protein [Roseivirga pacifica]SEW19801.1 SPFH domain, Band 7 family protein [Roseivirga pacifica]
MDNRRLLPIIVISVIALIVLIALSSSIFFTIQANERAVLFKKFSGGLDKENVISPGFHVKAPWNDLITFDVAETKAEETMDVLDKNGLSIKVDVSVRFYPKFDRIGFIYERFRLGYINTLVIPEVRSTVRQVMGRFTAEEIYSTKRPEVEAAIRNETAAVLGNDTNNVEMTALLIRSINLPDKIKQAIENKLQQEQEALAYQFRLDKEKSEAERKRIAAEGEAQANKIVNSSLTPNLLKMRGIEATLKLAESNNAKIVVIGQGDEGLPLILGNN